MKARDVKRRHDREIHWFWSRGVTRTMRSSLPNFQQIPRERSATTKLLLEALKDPDNVEVLRRGLRKWSMTGAAQVLGTENLDIKRRFLNSGIQAEEAARILEQFKADHPEYEIWKDQIINPNKDPK